MYLLLFKSRGLLRFLEITTFGTYRPEITMNINNARSRHDLRYKYNFELASRLVFVCVGALLRCFVAFVDCFHQAVGASPRFRLEPSWQVFWLAAELNHRRFLSRGAPGLLARKQNQ